MTDELVVNLIFLAIGMPLLVWRKPLAHLLVTAAGPSDARLRPGSMRLVTERGIRPLTERDIRLATEREIRRTERAVWVAGLFLLGPCALDLILRLGGWFPLKG